MDFNLFDVFALAILVFAIVAGVRTGALPQVGGILGALVGLVLLFQLAPWLLDVTEDMEPLVRAIVVLGAVFGGVIAGEALGSALGHTVADGLGTGVISGLDRAAGGLARRGPGDPDHLARGRAARGERAADARPRGRNSTAVSPRRPFLPAPTEVVGEIAGVIDASGLPDVFVGLEPAPLAPVDTPQRPEGGGDRPRGGPEHGPRSRAAPATPRSPGRAWWSPLATSSPTPTSSPARSDVRVELPSGDRRRDASCCSTRRSTSRCSTPRGPTRRPCASRPRDPDRGAIGAALGYAGGGPLVVLPAGVTGEYAAQGRDIYARRTSTRDIVELRAGVEPGDSGGPLVLENGTIGGLVFAESRADDGVGYALTPDERRGPDLARDRPDRQGRCRRCLACAARARRGE